MRKPVLFAEPPTFGEVASLDESPSFLWSSFFGGSFSFGGGFFLRSLFQVLVGGNGDVTLGRISQHLAHDLGDLILEFVDKLCSVVVFAFDVAELLLPIPVSSQLVRSFSRMVSISWIPVGVAMRFLRWRRM